MSTREAVLRAQFPGDAATTLGDGVAVESPFITAGAGDHRPG